MIIPKKSLGQHFLRDENIAAKITGLLSPESENILEIGPGTGILTKHLLRLQNKELWFIEVDRRSVEYLREHFSEHSSRIIHASFTEYDVSSLFQGNFSIIGNFPYNISSQIFFRALDLRDHVSEVIGMLQKEVAERIASPPGSKRYGILSVLLQTWFDIHIAFTVNPKVFFPPPKVTSAVVHLQRNSRKTLSGREETYLPLVKTAFNQRRKTLKNALKDFRFSDNPEIPTLMTKRAEQLSVEDYLILNESILPVADND